MSWTFLLLLGAALCAGAINSVAGGGTFLTFPTLILAGISPIAANATNTAALFPGVLAGAWAYRDDFKRLEGVNIPLLFGVSVAGGAVGAAVLLLTPERTFSALVPWLLLAATALFAGGPWLSRLLRRRFEIGGRGLLVLQFAISFYGGYFGGAIGILMLAALQIFGMTDINAMGGLKNLLSFAINFTAVLLFIAAGKVAWGPALAMMVAAVIGGYGGARLARRTPPIVVRAIIITIGLTMTGVLFLRG